MKNLVKKLIDSFKKSTKESEKKHVEKPKFVPIKMLEIRPITPLKKRDTRTSVREEINHWRDNVRQVDKFLKRYSQKACY